MVLLGAQLFEQVEGAVAELFLLAVAAHGEEHGDGRVDDEHVDGAGTQSLGVLRAERAEGVVGLPVGRDVGGEQRLQLVDGLAVDELAQTGTALVVEIGQLGQTDVGEVLRPQAEEVPLAGIHRLHRELMGQILVLVAQTGQVAVAEGALLAVLGHGVQLQKSGLSEEDGLYLEEVVAVVGHGVHGHVERPLLEGFAVDAEAVVTGQRDEVGILPRAVALLGTTADVVGLAL